MKTAGARFSRAMEGIVAALRRVPIGEPWAAAAAPEHWRVAAKLARLMPDKWAEFENRRLRERCLAAIESGDVSTMRALIADMERPAS